MHRLVTIRAHSHRGFTLIEVMVVVVILGILAAIVVPRIIERPEQAKVVKAKQDVIAIENAMELYKLDNGTYPTQAQGIEALVKKPTTPPIPQNYPKGGYLKQFPMDPWGHKYLYKNPGQHGAIDIFSYGPTEKPGGQVIGSWNVQKIKN